MSRKRNDPSARKALVVKIRRVGGSLEADNHLREMSAALKLVREVKK